MIELSGRARARVFAATGVMAVAALTLMPQQARAGDNDGPTGSGGVKYYQHLLREARSNVQMSTAAPAALVMPGHTYNWSFTVTNKGPATARGITVTTSPEFRSAMASEECVWVGGTGKAPVGGSGTSGGGSSTAGATGGPSTAGGTGGPGGPATVGSTGGPATAGSTGGPATAGATGGPATAGATGGGTGPVSAGGAPASCRMDSLSKGESESGVITATVPASARAGQLIAPSATYVWTTPAGTQQANTAFPGVEVAPATSLGLNKSAPAQVQSGAVVPESVTVENRGANTAHNVVVNTTVTSGERVVMQTGSGGCNAGVQQRASTKPQKSAAFVCAIPAVPVGHKRTVVMWVHLAPSSDTTTLRCAAMVTSGTPLLTPTTNSGTCVTRVVAVSAPARTTGPQLPMTGDDSVVLLAAALILIVGGGVFAVSASRSRD